MSGVKNWTVACKSLKNETELMKMSYYINSKSNPNHKHTEITSLLNKSSSFIQNSLNYFNNKRNSDLSNSKVGRKVSSPGHDWVFSLPPGLRPSKKQWIEISKDIFREFSKHLTPNVSAKIFKKHCLISLHEEPEKNSHLHILTSNVILNEVQRDIKRKAALKGLKSAFTRSVLKHTGISNNQYVSIDEVVKKALKDSHDPIDAYLNLSDTEQNDIAETMNNFRHRNNHSVNQKEVEMKELNKKNRLG